MPESKGENNKQTNASKTPPTPKYGKIIHSENEVDVLVFPDEIFAFIRFSDKGPPQGGLSAILKILDNAGIVFGISKGDIDKAIKEAQPWKEYPIAMGKKPEQGKDGRLESLLEVKKEHVPGETADDNKVDYKELGLFVKVTRGQEILRRHPPIPGKKGISVFGQPIETSPIKDPPIPAGDNTKIIKNNTVLVAETDGVIFLKQKKINVSKIYHVVGDVDYHTGNIDFEGTVMIGGSVLTGFGVKASENVVVYGIVEGAEISAGREIHFHSGVQGQDKAVITCGGTIEGKFASNAKITAKDNIIFRGAVVHCTINTEGAFRVEGTNGKVSGGEISAIKGMFITEAGSELGTKTILRAGGNPDELESNVELKKELKNIDDILKRPGLDQEDPEVKKMLNRKMDIQIILDEELQKIEKLKKAVICVQKTVYPGVVIDIHGSRQPINKILNNLTFYLEGNKIKARSNQKAKA